MTELTDLDPTQPIATMLQQLRTLSLGIASSFAGASEPPDFARLKHGFWADSVNRAQRQYPADPTKRARALWTLESGPFAIVPRNVAGDYTLPDMIGADTGTTTFTWPLSDTTAGSHTVTLPASVQSPNTVIGHVHQIQGGSNIATLAAQGSDVIADPTGGSSSSSVELRTQGDILVVYTIGTGVWRVLIDRRAGVLATSSGGALSPWDRTVTVNAAAAPLTRTLPDPSRMVGQSVLVCKVDASANVVTVQTAAGTIDGAASYPLVGQWAAARFTAVPGIWLVN